jgi:hypothetical protein
MDGLFDGTDRPFPRKPVNQTIQDRSRSSLRQRREIGAHFSRHARALSAKIRQNALLAGTRTVGGPMPQKTSDGPQLVRLRERLAYCHWQRCAP